MITINIPFTVQASGMKITAYKYKIIDETRAGHCEKAVRGHDARRRRRK